MNNQEIFDTIDHISIMTNRTKEILVNNSVLILASESYDDLGRIKGSSYKVFENNKKVFSATTDEHNAHYLWKYSDGKWEQDIKEFREMLVYNLETGKRKTK